MAQITKALAEKIAKKLKAKIVKKRAAHDQATVYHEGRMICIFGIRRGSKKEAGHDHIPDKIHVSSSQARLLGQCPMSYEEWVDVMKTKGHISS